jgi:LmbE family N-acetylglucosaminyl deacetylase
MRLKRRSLRKPISLRKRIARTIILTFGAILAFYWYQPNRYDLIPRTLPTPNPPVNPESNRLFAKGTRIAIITAHPDDAEFFLGGTLSRLHDVGAITALIVCTDGDKGYYPFEDYKRNRRIRRQETVAAASAWGAQNVHFLGQPDGRLGVTDATQAKFEEDLAKFKPEYILCFDGDYPPRVSHSDHRNSGTLAEAAATKCPTARWLLKFSTIAPNYTVDITNYWDRKEALVRIHRSQFVDYRQDFLNRIGGRAGDPWPGIEGIIMDMAELDGERIHTDYRESLRAICLK